MPRGKIADESLDIIPRHVATGQRRVAGPRAGNVRKETREIVERMLGKPAMCRELSAKYRQKRRRAVRRIEIEGVIPRHRRDIVRAVVEKRPDARISPDDIAACDRLLEPARNRLDEIIRLVVGNDGMAV